MNETLQNLMREATRLTRAGNLNDATRLIQRALGNDKRAPTPPVQTPPLPSPACASPIVLDGCVFEVANADTEVAEQAQPEVSRPSMPWRATSLPGEFVDGSHSHSALTRQYKLYIPAGANGDSLPLVVMLHGCTQNADDFAAGTGMNELAKAKGFYVLYPEQSTPANPQRCWNWFKHNHQARGRGEVALLASMTMEVIKQNGIDPRRVYIAGLSAGGAMAAIVAAAYPEIYAAVGVHSGLAVGAAGNVSEALAAMKSGAKDIDLVSAISPVPTIVFHGDKDGTVHPRNGQQVIATFEAGSEKSVERGRSNHGQAFTRTRHLKTDGNCAELWVLHGAGHAWSGGSAKGSYTDPSGPDASTEMLRFFSEHVKPV